MKFTIYLVEDEENLNHVLKSYLEKEGWEVVSFLNGEDARRNIKNRPHLWILDIMLPEVDGYQLIKEIKEDDSKIPVIFISARDEDLDRIIGLEMGSEDYLPKPFLPRELVIRTKRLLQRIYKYDDEKLHAVKIGPYTVVDSSRSVYMKDIPIELTSKEYDLLKLFKDNPMKVFTRDEILNKIWGEDYFGNSRVVDDLVRRVRKRMPYINLETVYGCGYRMVITNET